MAFCHNENVEISHKQGVFLGSYYPARILAAIEGNKYLVEYRTLYTTDQTSLLTAQVNAADVRPVPPEISVSNFLVNDRVDAFLDGVWWVGWVTHVVFPYFYVLLNGTGEEVPFLICKLRLHLDWEYGKWVLPQYWHMYTQARSLKF